MRTIILFLSLGILVSACERNSCDSNDIIINDSIYFKDLSPDILITATDSYGPDGLHFCDETPTPTDSIAKYFLDLNNDSIFDFEFNVERWRYDGVGSSFHLQPCLRYKNHSTTISSLNDSNKVCVISGTPLANEFLFDDIILNDSTWVNSIWPLYINSVEKRIYHIPENIEYYLGVQIYKDNRYYFGWILMNVSEDQLIIKEYGINLSENLQIKAGQEE